MKPHSNLTEGPAIVRIICGHNYYQQSGGEDTEFFAEQAVLRRYGHVVIEYTDHNDRVNQMNQISAALNTVWSRSSQRRLLTVLRGVQPDVAHFHNTFLLISPSSYYACKEAGVAVVQTLQNYRLLCPAATFFRDGHVCEDCVKKTPPWPGVVHGCWRTSRSQTAVVAAMLSFHRWLKTWEQQVDVYIGLTEFARRKFIEGGLPADKIVVKPNFIFPDPRARTTTGDYALFVGRISPEKGILTLIQAWKRLVSVPLKVVGDGPLLQQVRSMVSMQGLNGIEIFGRRAHQEVLELMKRSRFLVFPSQWYEGFPLTIVEAFASGVPVVATRLGAMAEIVEHGRTGLHFEPGNAEELAASVEWAWTHEKELIEMGKNARSEYELKYTAERNYEMLMQAYDLAKRRARERYGSRYGASTR
jgi:glycosyltransferase involved in cell wall biosynthesis